MENRQGGIVRAADVMVSDPRTVVPATSVWAALALMRQHDIRHLLIVDGNGKLEGILSNRDYRRVLERTDPQGVIHSIHDITVAKVMTPGVRIVTASPDTPLLNIAQLMVKRKVGSVPVVDERRRPVGILTQKDVMRELVSQLTPPPVEL